MNLLQKENKELEGAKKIFYSFDCNTFFMMKEGKSGEYDKYHVGKIQENKWRDEYVAHRPDRMLKDGFSMEALWHIRNAGSNKCIPVLVTMAKKGDSYVMYWIADTIWHLSRGIFFGRSRGRVAAIELYEELNQSKVTISKQHKTEIDQMMMEMFSVKTPEEYILARAKQDLINIKNRNK